MLLERQWNQKKLKNKKTLLKLSCSKNKTNNFKKKLITQKTNYYN